MTNNVTHERLRRLACCLLWLGVSGCALTSRGDPLLPRYFSPETTLTTSSAPTATARDTKTPLRLGRVAGSSYLREEWVFRNSEYEVHFDELQRWTEKPEAYLRHALSRALFESGAFARTDSRRVPALEVELLSFEEIRSPPHRVRIRALFLLHDDGAASYEETFTIERPVVAGAPGDPTLAAVAELSRALSATADHIARRIAPLLQNTTDTPLQTPSANLR